MVSLLVGLGPSFGEWAELWMEAQLSRWQLPGMRLCRGGRTPLRHPSSSFPLPR